MSRWLLLLAFVVFTLSVGAQTNPATGKQETVEAVRTHWVEQFKGDPAGKVEVFHIGGKKTVIGQENYVIGLRRQRSKQAIPSILRRVPKMFLPALRSPSLSRK
jgi:hypothetical protein